MDLLYALCAGKPIRPKTLEMLTMQADPRGPVQ